MTYLWFYLSNCFHPSSFFSCVGTCLEGMFLCSSEDTCIAGARQCDGIPDCAGGEDEQLCESKNMAGGVI